MRHLLILLMLVGLCTGCEAQEAADAAASSSNTPAATPPSATPPPPAPADAVAQAPVVATNYFEITTPQGRLVIRLYDETPIHRDNFRKLASAAFYDSTLFHRVIGGFMIQGGDPNSRDDDLYNDGNGGPGYTVEAEIVPQYFHKRGAIAAARQPDQVNPQRRSSGSQFYIVHGGRAFPPEMLAEIEGGLKEQIPNPDFQYSEAARAAYSTDGGAPHLDGMYTIFGEVVEGFDVLDRIAALPTPRSIGQQVHPALLDRPASDVSMAVRPLPDYRQ